MTMTARTRRAAGATAMSLVLALFANKIMSTSVYRHMCCFDGQDPAPLKIIAWIITAVATAFSVLSFLADQRQEANQQPMPAPPPAPGDPR